MEADDPNGDRLFFPVVVQDLESSDTTIDPSKVFQRDLSFQKYLCLSLNHGRMKAVCCCLGCHKL